MMRKPRVLFLIVLGLVAAPITAPAQDGADGGAVDPRFDSPRTTMFTFLGAINAVNEGKIEQWAIVIDCLDLSGVGVEPGSEDVRNLARDLWGALNHIREVTEQELPDAASLGDQRSFVYFPKPFSEQDQQIIERIHRRDLSVELAKAAGGAWRFSAQTVAGITDLYRALKPLGRKFQIDEARLETRPWLSEYMPAYLTDRVFELEYWQWLGLAVLILLGLVLDQVVRWFARPVLLRLIRKYAAAADDGRLRKPARPIGLLAAGLFWLGTIRLLGIPGEALVILLAAARLFAILSGVWTAWRITDLVSDVLITKAARTATKFDDVLIPLVRKAIKIFIFAFGLIYGAQSLSINIVPLVTGLGIGGLAFAFAAKDTIENFFGSIAVILDRPFEVGDWVVIGDTEGTVEELGFRSTRIRTFYNSQITVPNATLVRTTVDNYGRRRYRRWKTHIGVQYDTTPDQLIAFTEGIRELVRTHPYTRKDYFQVWCHEFTDFSLNILIYVFHEVPDWSTELRERERLFIDIVRLADRLGVQFAFPTRTLHLYNEQHKPHEAQHTIPGVRTDHRAEAEGIRTAQQITEAQPWKGARPGAVTYREGPTPLDDESAQTSVES